MIKKRSAWILATLAAGVLATSRPASAEAGWLEYWDIMGSQWCQYSCGSPFPTTGICCQTP